MLNIIIESINDLEVWKLHEQETMILNYWLLKSHSH